MPDKKTESMLQEAIRLISKMSDEQCIVVYEAFKIQLEDETKTPEECVMLARERLESNGEINN
jgi:hypothetical protein